MRQRPLLKTMFLLCAMLVWSHCLYAQGYYQKVTTTPLTSGQYLIVCEGKSRILDGSLSIFEVEGNYRSVSISNNQIEVSSNTEAAEFTLEAAALDAYSNTIYSFMNKAGKYIGNEHTNPGLENSTSALPNIISINDGNATIYNKGNDNYKLQFNNGSSSLRFIYQNGTQTPVQLYKRIDATTPATIKINMNTYGLATYASSFDLDFSAVEGLEAYVATYGTGTITLTKKDVIPANQGMLLRATDGVGKTYSIPTTTTTAEQAISGNLFVRGKGIGMNSVANGIYGYILNVVDNVIGFYLASGQFVATNRAYLRIDTSQFTAGARIDLNFEDAAGINDVDQNHNENRNCYDLQGRRVAQPQQGLYIINGKKVVIK